MSIEANRALVAGNRQLASMAALSQARVWKLFHLFPIPLFPQQQQGTGSSPSKLLLDVLQGTFVPTLQQYVQSQRTHHGALRRQHQRFADPGIGSAVSGSGVSSFDSSIPPAPDGEFSEDDRALHRSCARLIRMPRAGHHAGGTTIGEH